MKNSDNIKFINQCKTIKAIKATIKLLRKKETSVEWGSQEKYVDNVDSVKDTMDIM